MGKMSTTKSANTQISKFSSNIQSLCNELLAFPLTIYHHLGGFFDYLDLTEDCTSEDEATVAFNSKPESTWIRIQQNVHYLVPFLILVINFADSGLIMAKENFRYNRTGMNGLVTHKYYPQEMRYPGTCIMHMAVAMSIVVLGVWLFKPQIDRKYIIFVYTNVVDGSIKVLQGGRVWNQVDAERFVVFRRKAHHYLRFLQITVYFSLFPYWLIGLVLNYKGEFRDFLFLFYLPFYVMYNVWGVVYISFFIFLSANYMRFQQSFLLKKIEALTGEIRKTQNTTRRLAPETIWRRFNAINTEILNFFEQLRAVSRFWSPYLSAYFLGHICMEVFTIYGLIFDGAKFDLLMRSIFVYYAVEFLLLMIVITEGCSAIVRHNVKIYKTNVAFCYAYTRKYRPNLMFQMKMSKMIANYKGTRNGFRLVTNYVVDSKMFEAIFFYISTIFLKVFSDQGI